MKSVQLVNRVGDSQLTNVLLEPLGVDDIPRTTITTLGQKGVGTYSSLAGFLSLISIGTPKKSRPVQLGSIGFGHVLLDAVLFDVLRSADHRLPQVLGVLEGIEGEVKGREVVEGEVFEAFVIDDPLR